MYSGARYPNMLSGPGYIMSRQTSRCLHAAAMEIPYFHMEDVYITGFAAEMCNIKRTHIPRFHNNRVTFNHAKDYIDHYVDPATMKRQFAKMAR